MAAGRNERRRIALYALPGLALAMPTIPAYVFLPAFYAEDVGIGLTATGLALLAARAVDTVSDPLIGAVSDRFKTRWGHRKPWIFLGAILAGIALIALFTPPAGAGIAYLIAGSVALYTGWTMVMVPYTAWGAELSSDYDTRSQITSAREAAMLGGIVLAGAVPALAAFVGASRGASLTAAAVMAVAVGAVTIPLLLAFVPETARAPIALGTRLVPRLRELRGNRPFLRLLAAWFVNGLANGIPAALFPLYLEHGLQVGQGISFAAVFVYFLSGVLAIPLWLRLTRSIGKHRAWSAAMILACAAFIWVPLLAPGQWPVFLIICVATGAALGADLALPPALQADVVDYHSLRFGGERTGFLFALWSMATKLALALAVGIAFPLLELLGIGEPAAMAKSVVLLALVYAGLPVLLKIGTIAIIWGHPITRRRQTAIRARLSRRRAGPAAP